MKRIVYIVFAAFVLSLVPATYACAQTGHIESPLERKARLEREAAAKKRREQEAAARRKREQEAREQAARDQALKEERDARKEKVKGLYWDGFYRFQEDNGKWGFLDGKFDIAVSPTWKDVSDFSQGTAMVKDDNDKWGVIDKTGKVIIPCQWKELRFVGQGMATVKDDNDKWGVIDMTGKTISPCQWKYYMWVDGRLFIVTDDTKKKGLMDMTGKMLSPCQWTDIDPYGHEDMRGVENDSKRWGFVDDNTGTLVIPCIYKRVSYTAEPPRFIEGLAAVRDKDDKCGYIDKTGKVVLPFQWVIAKSFHEGLAEVATRVDHGIKRGFIDKTGKLVIPCQWEVVLDFENGKVKVKGSDGKWVYIDKTGKIVE